MENRLRPNELEAVKRLEAAKIIVRGEKGYVWDALEGVKYGRMEYGRLVSMLERIVAGIRAQGSQKQNESLDKNLREWSSLLASSARGRALAMIGACGYRTAILKY